MSRHSRIGLAVTLAITCAVKAPDARAGYVTPDTIGTPIISASTDRSTVAAGTNLVDQYEKLGILFPNQSPPPDTIYSTAVIRLNNLDLFTGASRGINYGGGLTTISFAVDGVSASLVKPGTTTPDVADSVTATFDSVYPVLVELQALDKNGNVLKTTDTQVQGVLTPVEIDVAGIQSIYARAFQPVIDPPYPGFKFPPGYPQYFPFAWGVSSIEWHEAPEPAGFVLGVLGLIVLVGYVWRRRPMRVHKMPA